MAIDWSGLPESIRQTGDQISEEAYVAKRMSETLAEVYMTIIGDDAEEAEGNAIDKVLKAAQVLRMEVELYRAAASAHTIGEDAANVAIGKDAVTREQIIEWGKLAGFETSLQRERNLERLGDFAIFARMDYAKRAALTAEKVAGQEPYGYAPVHPNGNYFTRNKSTADYVGGLMPVYAAPQQTAQPVAQKLALTDEQRHSVDFAAALLEVKGYTGRARDLRSILAAQPVSGGKS